MQLFVIFLAVTSIMVCESYFQGENEITEEDSCLRADINTCKHMKHAKPLYCIHGWTRENCRNMCGLCRRYKDGGSGGYGSAKLPGPPAPPAYSSGDSGSGMPMFSGSSGRFAETNLVELKSKKKKNEKSFYGKNGKRML